MSSPVSQFFAVCPRGLHEPLAAELKALGAGILRQSQTGVAFEGDAAIGYRANLHSRLASRILLRLDSARYQDDDDLYRIANRQPWESLLHPRLTLRIDLNASRSPLRSLNFATLRVKDGLVDRMRARAGDRPSIDVRNPGARVFAHLDERFVTLYLDWSGEPLFKRGWRASSEDHGQAPLKENLAAGLLALSHWTPRLPLLDPFCGSGTIAIEAAQQAAGIAPGTSRRFGFEQLPGFDAELWQDLRSQAMRARTAPLAPILASDIDPRAIAQLKTNQRRAGLPEEAIEARVLAADQIAPPDASPPGLIVANPPFGERIGLLGVPSEDEGWQRFGQTLKQRFDGWKVFLLSSDLGLPRRIGMKERRKTPLFNGAIECRLFGIDVFAVTRGEARPAPDSPIRNPSSPTA